MKQGSPAQGLPKKVHLCRAVVLLSLYQRFSDGHVYKPVNKMGHILDYHMY